MLRFITFVALALALGISAGAQAQQGPFVGPPQWLKQLDLDDAQQERVFRIFYEQAPAIRERLQAARRAHEKLEMLALEARLDTPIAEELAAAQSRALAEVAQIRLEGMQRVYELLTDEQRAQAVRLRLPR